MLKLVRIIRLLRLIKLVRLVRGARILKRWESKLAINYSTLTLWQSQPVQKCRAHSWLCGRPPRWFPFIPVHDLLFSITHSCARPNIFRFFRSFSGLCSCSYCPPLRPALRQLGCGALRCGSFPPRELVRPFVLRLVPRDPVLRVAIAPAAGAVPTPQRRSRKPREDPSAQN